SRSDRLRAVADRSGSRPDRLRAVAAHSGSRLDRLCAVADRSGSRPDRLCTAVDRSGSRPDRLRAVADRSGSRLDRLCVLVDPLCLVSVKKMANHIKFAVATFIVSVYYIIINNCIDVSTVAPMSGTYFNANIPFHVEVNGSNGFFVGEAKKLINRSHLLGFIGKSGILTRYSSNFLRKLLSFFIGFLFIAINLHFLL